MVDSSPGQMFLSNSLQDDLIQARLALIWSWQQVEGLRRDPGEIERFIREFRRDLELDYFPSIKRHESDNPDDPRFKELVEEIDRLKNILETISRLQPGDDSVGRELDNIVIEQRIGMEKGLPELFRIIKAESENSSGDDRIVLLRLLKEKSNDLPGGLKPDWEDSKLKRLLIDALNYT